MQTADDLLKTIFFLTLQNTNERAWFRSFDRKLLNYEVLGDQQL